ncbi:MAG TPA: hypothetical protein DEH78_12925 [Solibacterales bacterium]|nr:hypothetical protein [Bryobacterales bacterium]
MYRIWDMVEAWDGLRRRAPRDSVHRPPISRREPDIRTECDGWLKVAAGVTTADEVVRVTQEF